MTTVAGAPRKNMAEHLAPVLYYAGVHLMYASCVWIAALVLTSVPHGSATTKYWIWLATSLNFALPSGALFDKLFAQHLSFARPLGFIGDVGVKIAESHRISLALSIVWLLGSFLTASRLYLRVRNERRHLRQIPACGVRRGFHAQGIPVMFGTSPAPVVDGVWNPRISLPNGIEALLSEQELNAVLLHELTHAKRRDNLIRLVHEIVLCALWFHPMIWITSTRISLYRELSCDESVIQHARGRDLVSALSKLASPEHPVLLEATASSFMGARLARLVANRPRRTQDLASVLLTAMFSVVLAGCVFSTIAHTACCFLNKH